MLRITKRPIQQAVAAAFQKGRPYEKQSVLELVNSLAVFQACSLPMLVHATPTILSTAQKLGLRTPLNFVIKNTFFKVSAANSALLRR